MKLTKQERKKLIEDQQELLDTKAEMIGNLWVDEFKKYLLILELQHEIDIIDIKLSK